MSEKTKTSDEVIKEAVLDKIRKIGIPEKFISDHVTVMTSSDWTKNKNDTKTD